MSKREHRTIMKLYIMPSAAAWGEKAAPYACWKNLKNDIDYKNVRVAYQPFAYRKMRQRAASVHYPSCALRLARSSKRQARQ